MASFGSIQGFASIQTKAWLCPNSSGGSLAPGADPPWDCSSLLCSCLGAEASLLYSLHTVCGCSSSASSHPAHTDGPVGGSTKPSPVTEGSQTSCPCPQIPNIKTMGIFVFKYTPSNLPLNMITELSYNAPLDHHLYLVCPSNLLELNRTEQNTAPCTCADKNQQEQLLICCFGEQ